MPEQLDSVLDDPGADLMQRVWNSNPDAPSGTIAGDTGLVTQFVFGPVPEPTALVLTGLGFVSTAGVRLRRRGDGGC